MARYAFFSHGSRLRRPNEKDDGRNRVENSIVADREERMRVELDGVNKPSGGEQIESPPATRRPYRASAGVRRPLALQGTDEAKGLTKKGDSQIGRGYYTKKLVFKDNHGSHDLKPSEVATTTALSSDSKSNAGDQKDTTPATPEDELLAFETSVTNNPLLQYSTLQADFDTPAAVETKKAAAKSRRVHFLGANATALFLAHCLAGMSGRPPITFLMHGQHEIKRFQEEGEMLVLVKDKKAEARIGFDTEYSRMTQAEHALKRPLSANPVMAGTDGWIIDQLIVTTPGFVTTKSLLEVRERLRPTSTICFVQEGLGVIEKVNKEVFPDVATRPQYMLGTSSHGLDVHPERPFAIRQFREGSMEFSTVPSHRRFFEKTSSNLLEMLTTSASLQGTGYPYEQFFFRRLEDLAIESMLGSLSVMFGCKQGQLLHNYMISEIADQLSDEICAIARALPEYKNASEKAQKLAARVFYPMTLRSKMFARAAKGKTVTHKMARFTSAGLRTDIQYITGYFLDRAEEVGIDCPTNNVMMHMVRAKQKMHQMEASGFIPLEKRNKLRLEYGEDSD